MAFALSVNPSAVALSRPLRFAILSIVVYIFNSNTIHHSHGADPRNKQLG